MASCDLTRLLARGLYLALRAVLDATAPRPQPRVGPAAIHYHHARTRTPAAKPRARR